MTGSTARQRAEDQAKIDVIAALAPICLEQSKKDPQLAERVAVLKAASSWSRGDIVLKNGWATMPGATAGNAWVAGACAEKMGL